MRKIFLFLPSLMLLCHACGRPASTAQTSAPGGDTLHTQQAEGFTLIDHGTYREAVVYNPWKAGTVFARYYLVCDTAVQVPTDGVRLQVPLRRMALTSVTYVGFMSRLGTLDRVDGLCTPALVYDADLRRRVEDGFVTDLGDAFSINTERTLSLHPQAVMASGYNQTDTHMQRLAQAGVPVVYALEWMERSLLGRAEWIKFVAAFVGKEAEADSLYRETARRYGELKALAAGATDRPQVMSGSAFRGTWYMPAGDSFMTRLFRDAGAAYRYADEPGTGSLPLNMETVLMHFADADVWLNCGYNTRAELLEADPKHALFRPVQEERVYHFNRRTLPGGANDFWEGAVARPDLLLADVLAVLHPDLLPEHEPVYIGKVE